MSWERRCVGSGMVRFCPSIYYGWKGDLDGKSAAQTGKGDDRIEGKMDVDQQKSSRLTVYCGLLLEDDHLHWRGEFVCSSEPDTRRATSAKHTKIRKTTHGKEAPFENDRPID